jgi:hypothetical protein
MQCYLISNQSPEDAHTSKLGVIACPAREQHWLMSSPAKSCSCPRRSCARVRQAFRPSAPVRIHLGRRRPARCALPISQVSGRRRRRNAAKLSRPAPSSAIDAGSGTATSVITTSPLPVWKSATRIWSVPASNRPVAEHRYLETGAPEFARWQFGHRSLLHRSAPKRRFQGQKFGELDRKIVAAESRALIDVSPRRAQKKSPACPTGNRQRMITGRPSWSRPATFCTSVAEYWLTQIAQSFGLYHYDASPRFNWWRGWPSTDAPGRGRPCRPRPAISFREGLGSFLGCRRRRAGSRSRCWRGKSVGWGVQITTFSPRTLA